MVKKRSKVRLKEKRGFEYDVDELLEYAKPAPRQDAEGQAISQFLSRMNGRAATGYVVDWQPTWLEGLDAFKLFFYDDKLVIDIFSSTRREIEVFDDSVPPGTEQQIARKSALCAERGLIYVPVRPDEELDTVQLAARLGKTKVKKKEEATI